MILPEEFLSLAEESGLIIPIGDWTLMTACQQCADWADELYVSVSISDKQFNYGDIVESVRKALKLSGLRPSRLELGLKESALANHAQSTDRKIKALKALGVTLAIDGFGTGCSTINVIRQFLIDKIKVDPSLVGEIGAAESGFELMQAIITLAKSLNLSVLAEGVEKQTQLDFLKTCHCEQVQGNLLSQAMSGTEFQTWVKDFNQGDQTPP